MQDYPAGGAQVTSDCRPWRGTTELACCQSCGTVQKILSKEWYKETGRIYKEYSIYAQSEGSEQRCFTSNSGASCTRSSAIISWISKNIDLREEGRLLDIGCGNGSFLRTFHEAHPSWTMIGAELDSRYRLRVEEITGVEKLYTGDVADLEIKFDLITMIHSLEHIPNPISYIRKLRSLLNPNGLLFIEVPDLESSPFDILIVDHCTHFSPTSLRQSVELGGFQVARLDQTCIDKEISLIAGLPPGKIEVRSYSQRERIDDFNYPAIYVKWHKSILDQALSMIGNVGIFGTSISATWLKSALGDKVSFYIDEDASRIGKSHLGIPISSITDAHSDISILMPLRPDLALSIKNRLKSHSVKLVLPPSLASYEY